jgi:broad specificity phosphatase PhoE
VPLAPEGERQLQALARRLARRPVAAVYASDLQRTLRSAAILAAPHGLDPVAVPALREFAMGRWEGLTASQIRALDPEAFARWMAGVGEFQFPEGENLGQVAARAWAAFQDIVGRHGGEEVAVVAHGGSNRAILCRALGLPLQRILALGQDYAALSVLEGEAGSAPFRLRVLNHRESDETLPR